MNAVQRSGILPTKPDLGVRYIARKAETLDGLRSFTTEDCLDQGKVDELIRALHKLAGVAGLFGEARLGETAAAGVDMLRAAAMADRPAIVASLAAVMASEGNV